LGGDKVKGLCRATDIEASGVFGIVLSREQAWRGNGSQAGFPLRIGSIEAIERGPFFVTA